MKTVVEQFAALVKKTAVASVGNTSDWFAYQEEEPEKLRELYLASKTEKDGKY